MSARIRVATRADIDAMHAVRLSVRENVLRSPNVTPAAYVPEIETTGRGWVVEEEGGDAAGRVVGFAVGNARSGNIWALFVHPDHEGRGHGRRLHDTMVAWLFEQGLAELDLSTEPGTRAEAFYQRAGWQRAGVTRHGEARFVLPAPAGGGH